MYIEVTTFAIPTVLINVFQGLAFFALLCAVGAVFGAWLYDRSVTQGIRRNNEKCDKEIV